MKKVRIHFNRVREACYRAAVTGNKDELLKLLRSDYRLRPGDQKYLADYIEGLFRRSRGRQEDLDERAALARSASAVKKAKYEAKKQGHPIKHWDAIDREIERLGFALGTRTAAANKLANFISRSKAKKKLPR